MTPSNNQQNMHQQQQRMQQHMVASGMMGGARDSGSGNGGGSAMGQQQGGNCSGSGANATMTAPLMMNLMTNPALAAAASPLFPPAAMLSNSAAFLSMPEAFAMAGMNQNSSQHHQQQQNSMTGNGGGTNGHNGMVSLPRGMSMSDIMRNNYDTSGISASNNHQSSSSQHPHQTPIAPSMAPHAPFNITVASAHVSNHSGALANLQKARASAAAAAAACEKDKQTRPPRELSAEEKAKQNRDRNREHARSTRLRKKAYVQKLKELVECLHAERTEEVRQRRVAIQHLAEKQNVRRGVVRSFLRFQTSYETDARKWATLLEDDFWLKQPVTPYRSFRRAEIEQECRVSRGLEAIISDAASLSVMTEGMGSRSQRWMQIKREEFAILESANRGNSKKMPRCIQRQDSRLQHAVSSLSSSSGGSASNQFSSSGEEAGRRRAKPTATKASACPNSQENAAKVSSSSGSSSQSRKNQPVAPAGYHDYHAKPLPDPKLNDSEQDESPEESNGSSSNGETKRISADSSSGEDSGGPRAAKKRKVEHSSGADPNGGINGNLPNNLPPNIAKQGGIGHGLRAEQIPASVPEDCNSRLCMAPAVALPPFAGIGKKRSSIPRPPVAGARVGEHGNASSSSNTTGRNQPAVISADAAESSDRSTSSTSQIPEIIAQYHINEDDMVLMEDVLMCPFVFRSHNAVMCGALSECVMPGMLRAHFSSRNKLQSLELVYDAMGFMQQLERASGNEGTAQIIPGSLEMALTPSNTDALVITLAKPPYLIVNVNEVWTRTTGYTQMEVEGREYLALLEGEGTCAAAFERPGKPKHRLEEVSKGRCACSTNIHYDKEGRDYIEFVCSYPLTNAADEVTHLLHVSKELPSPHEASTRMGLDTSN